MATLLIRDDQRHYGYIAYRGELPRTREPSHIPWPITTADRRVVYARLGEHRTRPSRSGLRPYDTYKSKERRRLCQSALGSFALHSTGHSERALRKVSDGCKRFMIGKFWKDPDGAGVERKPEIIPYLNRVAVNRL